MADQLKAISIVAPGFAGLNTQDSSVSLTKDYALVAQNAVIDQFGRIAARRGWDNVNTSAGYNNTEPYVIKQVIKDDGTTEILTIGDNKIYSGTTSLTLKYTGSTWTAQDWKVIDFNDHTFFFQRNHDPLVYDHVANTIILMSAHASYSGTVPLANEVLGAFGRLWVADTTTDKVTITWSDALQGFKWSGGSSGSINLESQFTNGTDSIVALAAFNGFLIAFCKKSIIIFSGAAEDPTTNLKIVEVIDGVGCISRDSVQDVGSDIFFLADTGVRSLGRIIQEKSAPLFDVSRNVRDDLISDVIANNNDAEIKSVYYEKDGFYLLTLPTRGITYCFDLKSRLPDGSCKATTWTLSPKNFCATNNRLLYFTRPGYIGLYTGNNDNGSSFRFAYYTSHIDAGSAFILKILKKIVLLIIGGQATNVFLNWGVDYGNSYQSALIPLPAQTRAEYNVSEYNIAEYNAGILINTVRQQVSSTGRVFQIGIEADISSDIFSVQQLDVFVKSGRVI